MEIWEHQKEAISRAEGLDHYGLFFEAGTGKTRTLIEILRRKFTKEKRILRTLILCPTVVCHNWKDEWKKFSKVPEKEVVVLSGSGIERETYLKEKPHANILITNYQCLLMVQVLALLKEWGPEVIIADESHRIKSPGAQTTKRAISLGDKAKYKYILTGTPILKNLMDVYSQFKFLDSGETFGTSFNFFKNKYFYNKNAHAPSHVTWPDWVVRPNAEKEVNEKIFRKAMYVEKAKCLDLPPLVKKRIDVEMSLEQFKHYKQMEKEFVTYMGDSQCVANIALTKGLRLMQIVSGFMTLENGTVVRFKENPRLDALKDLLSDLVISNKVIVWACFKENYQMIREVCESLGVGYVELHGETKNREGSIKAFREEPEKRVLIAAPASAGEGINLTEASYSIYFSRNFNLGHDIQSEARNYRGGSERFAKITRLDLVCQKTIDEIVLSSLAEKQRVSDSVLLGRINAFCKNKSF